MSCEHRVPLNDCDNDECNNVFKDDKDDNGACCWILLPVAIAAVIIGHQYNASTSSCGRNDVDYFINLQLFLYIAGYIHIGWCAFRLFISCCSYSCSEQQKKQCKGCNHCMDCPQCLILLFNSVWAGIGLFIYTQEMDAKCQQTHVGIMVLSWSIIQYALIVLGCIFFVCYCCYKGLYFITEKHSKCKCNAVDRNETECEEGTATLV